MIKRFTIGIKKYWARITLLSLEVIFIAIAFFVALFVFVLIAKMVFLEKRENLDFLVFEMLGNHVNAFNTGVMQFFSFLGSHYFLIPANIILSAFFLIRKQPWYSIRVPVISITSLLLMFVLKGFFHRERPLLPLLDAAKGLSFPSGHALMSFAFYGMLIYIIRHTYRNELWKSMATVVLLCVIFLIGISRIYLRVHYASDVIAGFSLGLIWLVLSLSIINRFERFSQRQISSVVEK